MSLAISLRLDRAHGEGFSLDVQANFPGQGITALWGPSGSGKTTLLRCLAGLEQATGTIEFDGEIWQNDTQFLAPHRRAVGYVFQEPSLFGHLSVAGNLNYGRRRTRNGDGPGYEQLVTLLDLEGLLSRSVEGLSGGEKQRVAIARALLCAPRLLLLDEPLAALDLPRKQELMTYLTTLRAELSTPILYVTHALNEVAQLAEHGVALDAGRVVANGPLSEVFNQTNSPFIDDQGASVVLTGRITAREAQWSLAQVETHAVDSNGVTLWIQDAGKAVGEEVRVRVLARDVSIALNDHEDSSLLNRIAGEVTSVEADGSGATALVNVAIPGAALKARVTRRSVAHLALEPGARVWTQIKSAALIR